MNISPSHWPSVRGKQRLLELILPCMAIACDTKFGSLE